MTKARDLANGATALSAVSATELAYLDGVTSAVQTQIDGKQAVNAAVSTTELGYLDGVTSAIQTQLDAKTAKSTLTTTGDIYYASGANTPARLGIGSTGNVLTVASGIPSWAAPAGGGKVLQVVQSLTTGYVARTSSNTYEDANLTATITPTSASSKILVMITQNVRWYTGLASNPNGAFMRIMRDATAVWNTAQTAPYIGEFQLLYEGASIAAINYLDSPATTSATTYKPQYKQENNNNSHTLYFNYGGNQSTITLMEIGA
jgi:hypothetical protein